MGARAAVKTAPWGRLGAWLRLGRVSNLPTVWTNTLAAVALSGETIAPSALVACMSAMSTFYVAGMILNDAFDADYDSIHRPARPIPSGVVSKRSAFGVGLVGLLLACAGVGMLASRSDVPVGVATALAAALGALIIAYDAYHKNNPLSPVWMGACRALVYLTAAYSVSGRLAEAVLAASALQWSYVIGLTYAAKQEDLAQPRSFWPVFLVLSGPLVVAATGTGWGLTTALPHARSSDWLTVGAVVTMLASIAFGLGPLFQRPRRVGVAVGRLIAGIAVLDALLIATCGWVGGALLALVGAGLTHLAQRVIQGT